jgi:MoaA/NifB/PqqE/SkfB family radical SAM enzyme
MSENNVHEPAAYPLNQLYFYLTDTCNLRCRHCWIEPRYVSESATSTNIDPSVFETILDQAKPLGLTMVKLTGGEPLLHPRMTQLLDILRRRDLRLTVETNGTLCSLEMAKQLADFPEVFVSVSLSRASKTSWHAAFILKSS